MTNEIPPEKGCLVIETRHEVNALVCRNIKVGILNLWGVCDRKLGQILESWETLQ